MDPAHLLGLILACAPGVAPSTVQAIIDVESSGNVLAIGVNRGDRLRNKPRDFAEAAASAQLLLDKGANFDAGLMQINSANWRRLGLTPHNVFDPCTNIRAGATILTENYVSASKTLGPGRDALLAALSAYNTGNRTAGFRNGYVSKVNTAAARRAGVPAPSVPVPTTKARRTSAPSRSTAPRITGGVAPAAAWRGTGVWGASITTSDTTKEPAE